MPAVFVFIQEGCFACHEYLPRFRRLTRNVPFPVGVYDITQSNERVQEFARKMGVRATPTTVVLSQGRIHRHIGALPEAQIIQLLKSVI